MFFVLFLQKLNLKKLMIISREIKQSIIDSLLSDQNFNKVIVVYGARQVGKTTLIKDIQQSLNFRSVYYNCDFLNVQEMFSYSNAHNFEYLVKDVELLILDEAQRIRDIGMVLKILTDSFPALKIIASGSSSFELSNKINEPLTGRKIIYSLYPLSFNEATLQLNFVQKKSMIERLLRFGSYPALQNKTETQIIDLLNELTSSYLFKDIFTFHQLKRPEILLNLLRLLAFQIGNEVAYTELANNLKVDQTVVQNYINLLEAGFIIFKLPALSRNLRNEVSKSRKIYFWDSGIRNAIIQNFNPLDLRNDVGQLWENFCVVERIKFLHNQRKFFNAFFWRTYTQKEIDYIEEKDGKLRAFEFKSGADKKVKIPKEFHQAYPDSAFKMINPENFINDLFTDD